jgi:hypothetical protein
VLTSREVSRSPGAPWTPDNRDTTERQQTRLGRRGHPLTETRRKLDMAFAPSTV